MVTPRVFSYIVARDGGYAPNPFHGICTLACCKPKVRCIARPGDLVLGLSGRADGNRLIYGMVVAEKLSFADYWRDRRFRAKRPDMKAHDLRSKSGDNNYEPMPDGSYRQLPSRHSHPDGSTNRAAMQRDLGPDESNPVLIGGRHCYFGANAIPLPDELSFLITGRGHRCRFTPDQIAMAMSWFESLPPGVHGRPSLWPEEEDSWRDGAGKAKQKSTKDSRQPRGCSR